MSADQSETWERIAKDVRPGWGVVKYDASGETVGTVAASAELHGGVFRVPVRWQLGACAYEEVVEAPTVQRVARYIDSNVLMSSAGNAWLFRPEAHKGSGRI